MPLRILHLIDSLGRGGAERQLLQVVRYLSAKGVGQRVVFLYADDALAPDFHATGHTVVGLHGRRGLLHLPELLGPVTQQIRAASATLVSTQLPAADILGRLAAGRAGVPVVSTWQNTTYDAWRHDRRWRIRAALAVLAGIERRCHARAERFIAVSSSVRDSYTTALHIDRSRCVVVPNSLDASRFRTIATRPGVGGGTRLVHVGRHVGQKGLDVLLRALAKVAPEHEVSVDLFGTGPLTTELQRLSRSLGLSSRVRFRGQVEDVVPHLSAADGFVFPSRHEGLALAYLEALAAGLPVIASAIPANREVDPGARATRFFTPGDEDDLRRALEEFASAPDRRGEYARHAREVAAPFAIESIGERLHAIFESAGAPMARRDQDRT